jgi:hypothetical protein
MARGARTATVATALCVADDMMIYFEYAIVRLEVVVETDEASSETWAEKA